MPATSQHARQESTSSSAPASVNANSTSTVNVSRRPSVGDPTFAKNVPTGSTPSVAGSSMSTRSLGDDSRSSYDNYRPGQPDRTPSHGPVCSSRQQSSNPPSHADNVDMTEVDIFFSLLELLDDTDYPDVEELDLASAFQKASLLPPVTAEALSELDVLRILNNPKLRHDVNFDRELHFRPNMDGGRGKTKIMAADEYWRALLAEFILYNVIGGEFENCEDAQEVQECTRRMAASQLRLPALFQTIKEILVTLVPEKDHVMIEGRLDVSLIMIEISKGLFDITGLAQWLCRLLKQHCAPMRDYWVDIMGDHAAQAARLHIDKRLGEKELVTTLKQLLGILESMKLDIANHQIRYLRSTFIEDSVQFQTNHQMMRIEAGRVNISKAQAWLVKEAPNDITPDTPTLSKIKHFSSAVLRSILSQSHMTVFPRNFELDIERLRSVRGDLHTIIYSHICGGVFDQLIGSLIFNDKTRLQARSRFLGALPSLVPDSKQFLRSSPYIAVEMVRVGRDAGAAMSEAELIMRCEDRLNEALAHGSDECNQLIAACHEEQSPILLNEIVSHLRLSPMALHQAMVPDSEAPVTFSTPETKMKNAIRRLAHVAILHWHVWSSLIYESAGAKQRELDNDVNMMDQDAPAAQASSTRSDTDSDSDASDARRSNGSSSSMEIEPRSMGPFPFDQTDEMSR